eukprot:TRINITY_DN815_c0_g1_i3.p1 TRINITY_DN815_c0_g1~~TRINITY_DN815_c0_g1_i3.p1  ORF type:complete len:292 (+),score=47.99 TRINITY_DN815_c0_g1_i3:142-1017(+)
MVTGGSLATICSSKQCLNTPLPQRAAVCNLACEKKKSVRVWAQKGLSHKFSGENLCIERKWDRQLTQRNAMAGQTWLIKRLGSGWAVHQRLTGAGSRGCSPVRGGGRAVVVDDLGGQYEDTFDDVEKRIMDFFTFKAVRHIIRQQKEIRSSGATQPGENSGAYDWFYEGCSLSAMDRDCQQLVDYFTYRGVTTVLTQLHELNPGLYRSFYKFVAENKLRDSKLFIRSLVKENQELAERVMVTRLHLYNKWIKKYDHERMYLTMKEQNLELLRERLMQTVKFESEGEHPLQE